MKGLIYCRQSSGDEDFSESVEVQTKNCRELAQKENIDVVGVFCDLNSSGKLYPSGFEQLASIDLIYQKWLSTTVVKKSARPGLGDAFKLLKEIDYIIVDDFTRLARPLSGSFLDSFITQMLLDNDVKLLTVKSGIIDLGSFNDALITTLQNRINDNQIAIQRKKSMDGLKKLKDAGIHKQGLGRVFGLKYTGKKYEIEIDPEEIEVVKYIYKEFLNGAYMSKIRKHINENYKQINKGLFTNETIRKTLRRPFYCGYIYDSNKNLIKSKQLEKVAVIKFSDWEKIQFILDKRRLNLSKPKKQWLPLSGLIKCGKCGSRMTMRKSCNIPKYICAQHMVYSSENCHTALNHFTDNEGGVGILNAIMPILSMNLLNTINQNVVDSSHEITELKIKLQNLKEKEKKITEMFIKNIISDDVAEAKLAELNNEIKSTNNTIIKLTDADNAIDDQEKSRQLFRKLINNRLTNGEAENLIYKTIKEIIVFKEKAVIKTNFGDIELPRKKIWIYNELPRYTFSNIDNKNFTIYYYHKDLPMANIYAKNKTTLFKNDCMTIYYVD